MTDRVCTVPAPDDRLVVVTLDFQPIRTVAQSLSARLDYQWDWSQWLCDDWVEHSWFLVTPVGGLTVSGAATTTSTTSVWLTSRGVPGLYTVTNRIDGRAKWGRRDDRSLRVRVAAM